MMTKEQVAALAGEAVPVWWVKGTEILSGRVVRLLGSIAVLDTFNTHPRRFMVPVEYLLEDDPTGAESPVGRSTRQA